MTSKELLKKISEPFNTYENKNQTEDESRFKFGERVILERRKKPEEQDKDLKYYLIYQTYTSKGKRPVAIMPGSDTLVFTDGFTRYEIEDKLWPFFSTVSYNLEPNGWGTRFPVLLTSLCDNFKVENNKLKYLLYELITIRKKFNNLKIKDLCLDINDKSKKLICSEEKSDEPLLKYFTTRVKTDSIIMTLLSATIEALFLDSSLTIERI